jgi:phosphatidylserine/phosphatidylglycerophosphate/cardiolipin synthase-like enzyme
MLPSTCDALVISHDPIVVSDLRRLWTADRERLEMPAHLSFRRIVGPERARRQFTALIEGARNSIRLIDAKLSDPDLVSLLKAKRAAGLTVETFTVKRLGDLKSHGKIMLLDDETVVVGSLALAALSLDFRREVAIVVTEPSAVATASELFQFVRDARPPETRRRPPEDRVLIAMSVCALVSDGPLIEGQLAHGTRFRSRFR